MKQEAVAILTKTFGQNPSVLNSISNRGKKEDRIKHLAQYAYKTAALRDGVYLSQDKNGCAIAYKYNIKKEGILDYWNQLLLVVNSIGVRKLRQTLALEKQHKRVRPESGEFIYFWFLGVQQEGRSGAKAFRELRDLVFQKADAENLPILLETSVPKNRHVYQLLGFEIYHKGKLADGNTLYYMRRNPNGSN